MSPSQATATTWTEDAPLSYYGVEPRQLFSSEEGASERKWRLRIDDLLCIRSLRDNWDGFGARAIAPDLVDAAIAFVRRLQQEGRLRPPDRIAPSPGETIVIVWEVPGEYVEAEVCEGRVVEWMLEGGGAETIHWQDSLPNVGDQTLFVEELELDRGE